MKLQYAEQIEYTDLESSKYDFAIAASGYESRCTYFMNTVELLLDNNKTKKIVFGFKEHNNKRQRIINDLIFEKMGFKLYQAEESGYRSIIKILDIVFKKTLEGEGTLELLIDYSCMTRVWFATLINYFQNKNSKLHEINITFSYSPSIFMEPQMPVNNKHMGPIPGIFRVSTGSKPTALIIGLGYEKQRARGIRDYLDPHQTFVFYTSPTIDAKFAKTVEKNNQQLIDSLSIKNVFKYSLNNLRSIDASLTSLCLMLRKDYKVILAPLGPKPFSLMSFLLASRYSDIDVWRVSGGDSGNLYDRKADTKLEPIICRTKFISERR